MKGTIYTFMACLSCLWLCFGCGNVQYKENAHRYAESILVDLDKKINSELPTEAKANDHLIISFQEMCQRAASADTNILATLSEMKKTRVDEVEATTRRWPRLNMQVDAELPLNNKFSDDFDLTGGLYFKYDILKAVAQPDEKALRHVLLEKNIEQLRLQLNGILGDILHNLTSLSLLDFKIERKTATLASVQKGYTLAEIYTEQNRLKGLELLTWREKLYSLAWDLEMLEQSKKETQNKLLALLGDTSIKKLTVSETEEVISKVLQLPDNLPPPSQIWQDHSEARLAEVEYIASEVMLQLAEMEKYPKFNASLGVGSIPLSGNDQQADSLFVFSVTMPLWDAGDQGRKVAKAQVDRNHAKDRLKIKAMDLWQRAKRAKQNYENALEYRQYLNKVSKDSHEYFSGRKKLVEEKRLDSLELLQDQIRESDAEIMTEEAKLKILEAAANYRFAIGKDIVEGVIPKIEAGLLNYASKFADDGAAYDVHRENVSR